LVGLPHETGFGGDERVFVRFHGEFCTTLPLGAVALTRRVVKDLLVDASSVIIPSFEVVGRRYVEVALEIAVIKAPPRIGVVVVRAPVSGGAIW